MLRRVAGHLFWTARNLERAEWRARLVNVNYHLLVESPSGTNEGWRPMLAITEEIEEFGARYPEMGEQSVLEFFTLDDNNPSSIKSCISVARENCRALRNHISSEMWLDMNGLYLDAQRWSRESFRKRGVYEFFAELRDRFYHMSGVLQNTMPRGPGYDFLVMGRTLEAAENVTRLLDVKYHLLLPHPRDVGSPLDLSQWAAVLRSASALEAYIGNYGNAIRTDRVVDFLLFNDTFPRAARFCVNALEASIARVAADGPGDDGSVPAVRTLATRLRSGSADAAIKAGLHEYLLGIQEDCARIGDEIFARYLRFE